MNNKDSDATYTMPYYYSKNQHIGHCNSPQSTNRKYVLYRSSYSKREFTDHSIAPCAGVNHLGTEVQTQAKEALMALGILNPFSKIRFRLLGWIYSLCFLFTVIILGKNAMLLFDMVWHGNVLSCQTESILESINCLHCKIRYRHSDEFNKSMLTKYQLLS